MPRRTTSDEHYVIDLCEEVLQRPALRQHRFDWLRGDPSPKTGRRATLPVDAYWPQLELVVEYAERQHDEPVPFFDKPDVITVSGVSRGVQRALYDRRRSELIPQRGLTLVRISSREFRLKRDRIERDREKDRQIVSSLLHGLDGRVSAG